LEDFILKWQINIVLTLINLEFSSLVILSMHNWKIFLTCLSLLKTNQWIVDGFKTLSQKDYEFLKWKFKEGYILDKY
jgi:hypothetical protein